MLQRNHTRTDVHIPDPAENFRTSATLLTLIPRTPNSSDAVLVKCSTRRLTPAVSVGDRADYYLLAKTILCQSFSATEVISLITCLMVRYSSNE